MNKYENSTKYGLPTSDGFFGEFGGMFVNDKLKSVLKNLDIDFEKAYSDENFLNDLYSILKTMSCRPTPLYYAKNLSEYFGTGAKVYLKREDLNHTGSHKLNNVLGQALLAKRMGKKKLIAETGAGQHGVATATVATYLGMECKIFMGAEDIKRQELNVQRMELLGAEVIPVTFGTKTLKEAVDAAIQYWVDNSEDTFYILGSAVGPHPYPKIVRSFQSIIGAEAREQILNLENKLPDYVLACVGGGSNSLGMFYSFIGDKDVKLIGLEAGGLGIETGKHGASITCGKKVLLHGTYQIALVDDNNNVLESHSVSAGIDYPGCGPELCYLSSINRVQFYPIADREAIDAFSLLSKKEGIVPAIESAHAVAYLEKLMPKTKKGDIILVCLSGRGDKDGERLIEYLK